MAFLAELKRRRVGKVAIGYGAVAWGVTEGCSVVFPALHVPEWAMTFVVVFLLVGFPVSMVLAWVFDVGPHGIHRTAPLPGEAAPATQIRQRAIFGRWCCSCMAGLGYLLYERGVGRADAGQPHDSIAVLPFTNLSGDPSKDYFSDGMSEELLTCSRAYRACRWPRARRRSPTRAATWTSARSASSSASRRSSRAACARQGDKVRITAQLIDTETGLPPVVGDVRSQARGHLRGAGRDRAVDRGQAAHPARTGPAGARAARAGARRRTSTPTSSTCRAARSGSGAAKTTCGRRIELYQAALGKDPAFARANAALASAYVVMPGYTEERATRRNTSSWPRMRRGRRSSVDPNIGEAHAVLAQINANRGNLLDAESGFFFAISLEPNEADAAPVVLDPAAQRRASRCGADAGAGARRNSTRPRRSSRRTWHRRT